MIADDFAKNVQNQNAPCVASAGALAASIAEAAAHKDALAQQAAAKAAHEAQRNFFEAQVRTAALTHAISSVALTPGGADADKIVAHAQKFAAYLRGDVANLRPVGSSADLEFVRGLHDRLCDYGRHLSFLSYDEALRLFRLAGYDGAGTVAGPVVSGAGGPGGPGGACGGPEMPEPMRQHFMGA